jgi:CheY-like chemotaxis protein
VQRRHALEINDNVVQGLTAAIYAFESGFSEVAVNALRQTLAAARTMMDNLLGPGVDTMVAGDFTRAEPAPEIVGAVLAANATPAYAPVRTPQSNGSPRVTVFLIDDAEDIRVLLRYALHRVGEFSVIGEAADGAEALEMIRELTPAVVVVDLAMPKMDGLEVISALRDSQPGVKIIALSGFDRGRMEGTAIAAGADAYLEKGTALRDIAAVLTAMVSPQEPLATR